TETRVVIQVLGTTRVSVFDRNDSRGPYNSRMAWFKKTRKPIRATHKESRVPEGLWVKCPSCGKAIYNKDLLENLKVCDKCAHHFRMDCHERLAMLFDDDQWTE